MLTLLPGGTIGDGRSEWEESWRLDEESGNRVLTIGGRVGDTCRLARGADGVWRGRWLQYEQMPVELMPLGEPPATPAPERTAQAGARAVGW